MLIHVVLMYIELIHVVLMAVVVLIDETIVVEEAMAVLRADPLLSSVLNTAGT